MSVPPRFGITGVFKGREQGKTTYAVKYLVREVHSGINYDEGYSNIHIGPEVDQDGKHYGDPKITFVNWEDMMNLKVQTRNGVPRALLLVDQAANYADKRSPNSIRNLEFARFTRESRQHGVDIIYTAWSPDEIDAQRLMPWTDLRVSAMRVVDGFVYDRWWKDKLARKLVHLPPEKISIGAAQAVWGWFDSAELIDDPTIPLSGQQAAARARRVV